MQAWGAADIDAWLAAVLMGRQPPWPSVWDDDTAGVLAIADAEGVAELLQAQLQSMSLATPTTFRAGLDQLVRMKAARSLYLQAQCRAILARLTAADVPVLVIKGSALAYWAYAAPHLRECSDIDLLFPSAEAARTAVDVMAPLGFAPVMAASAGDMVDFEMCCVRGARGERVEADLHWHLSNAPLFAFRFGWDELWASSQPLPALAPTARGLAPVPALLHACMHRAQNVALGGPDKLKWLYDFLVLARRFTDVDWQALRESAAARGLAGVCMDGLQAATARFGTFVPAGVLERLADDARRELMRVTRLRRWWYFQYMDWRAFPTARMRWRWLWQRLLPNAAYLRERHATSSVVVALWRRAWSALRRLRG